MAAVTNALELINDAVRLRKAIDGVLELYPKSEPLVNDIAMKLNLTDLADGLHDSPVQGERNEIARRKRTLANLQERAQALIERHPDVESFFKSPVQATRPTAGNAPFAIASTAAPFAELGPTGIMPIPVGLARVGAVTTGRGMARASGKANPALVVAEWPPDQSLAPVRVEERNGTIARISDRDSPLRTTEQDFNSWREPVLDHVQELLSSDFRQGTNHSRIRDRLVALSNLLTGNLEQVKDRQFRIGYEIERLDALILAYRSGADDMPALNAAVLGDLDRLKIALSMGIDKLERWTEFRRAVSDDPMQEGNADPVAIGNALDDMAAEMERSPKYFDPELPETFRFLAEAAGDPQGATKTVTYGAVKSAENVISFLGQRALGTGKNALGAVEQHISKAVAVMLITGLSRTAFKISEALPNGWHWLQPLVEHLMKMSGS